MRRLLSGLFFALVALAAAASWAGGATRRSRAGVGHTHRRVVIRAFPRGGRQRTRAFRRFRSRPAGRRSGNRSALNVTDRVFAGRGFRFGPVFTRIRIRCDFIRSWSRRGRGGDRG